MLVSEHSSVLADTQVWVSKSVSDRTKSYPNISNLTHYVYQAIAKKASCQHKMVKDESETRDYYNQSQTRPDLVVILTISCATGGRSW